MKAFRWGAAPLLLLVPFSLLAQGGSKSAPPPPSPAGVAVTTGSAAPPGARAPEIQDFRILAGKVEDPYELERLGVAFAQKGELERARNLFERSWKVGELPTAPFNLACLDARQKKTDAAFNQLERAVAAGFDDEKTLKSDADLAPIRANPRFSGIVAGIRKNVAAGDAAVVHEGTFIAPSGPPRAILVLLHDASSDPVAVSGPFVDRARQAGLFVAAPRGPAKAGKKRFGWGSPERAVGAAERGIAEAKRRAGNLPVLAVGVGRGGMVVSRLATLRPGLLAAAGTIGGPFDFGVTGQPAARALRGVRIFLGIQSGAPSPLMQAFRQGRDILKSLGLDPIYKEWPGPGTGFPSDARAAVQDVLAALVER